ncbi:T9SS type A sorting domain-containing protein [Mangrovimonas sp. ST2L15]|uniref:T9SS type A sorting domain-containing protein n=1 Tax=Mangrovimonas sp. ST2L15 TaxID=1645916 RepID=UPI0006B614BB|nr:T9SS type A sorting domain-containing protein [Mangrovimonas sp. ST2L15]
MKQILLFFAILTTFLSYGQTIYQTDFSTPVGFEHNNASPPSGWPADDFVTGNNFYLAYDSGAPVDTDGGGGYFRCDGTLIEQSDFGAEAYFESFPIDINGISSISISGLGEVTSGNPFNNTPTEYFQWSYQIDGEPWVYGDLYSGSSVTTLNTPAEWNSITGLDGSELRIRFYFNSNGNSRFEVTDITVEEIAATTTVEFTDTSASVSEGAGTIDVELSITNPSSTSPTLVQVGLFSGDPTDLGNYITQTITFPAGSSTPEYLTINITDDSEIEGDEIFGFTIDLIVGGDSASVGTNDTFALTVVDNDFDYDIIAIEDFDGSSPYWYNDIASQVFQDPNNANHGLFIQASSMNNSEFSGASVFGHDLQGEAGEPSLDPFVFTFQEVNIQGYENVQLKFDYYVNANNDSGTYEVFYDGVGQGPIEFYNNPNSGISGTVLFDVDPTATMISLVVSGTLEGNNDIIEMDNFMLIGDQLAPEVFTYAGGIGWVPNHPNDPSNPANPQDDIQVIFGANDADIDQITSDLIINDVTLQVNSSFYIETGINLTINGTLTLANGSNVILSSTSNSYSSLMLANAASLTASNGTGQVNYDRYVNTNATTATSAGDNDLISPPVFRAGQTFGSFYSNGANATSLYQNPSNTDQKLFGPFNKTSGTYLTYNVIDDFSVSLVPATGYRAATNDDGSNTNNVLRFRGLPSVAPINRTISKEGPSYMAWNVIGNPYSTYLSLEDFLTTNIASFDPTAAAIYGYNAHTNGSSTYPWTIWNLAYLEANPDAAIAPGQGFLVTADDAANVNFDPSMRRLGNSDDFIFGRMANPSQINTNISFIRLNLQSSSNIKYTEVYFNNSASLGLDLGYDARVFGDNEAGDFDIYTHMLEDNIGEDMAIQTLNYEDLNNNLILPLGINGFSGQQINISISESTLPSNILVYLDDILTGNSILLNNSDYIFTPSSNLNGIGRFYLRFENPGLTIEENSVKDLVVYTKSNDIYIKGKLSDGTKISLFDIQGKKVIYQNLDSEENLNILHTDLSEGVYVLRINENDQIFTKKIILSKK